jgi:tRNA(Arg) A34 adenosine deaminase TadA
MQRTFAASARCAKGVLWLGVAHQDNHKYGLDIIFQMERELDERYLREAISLAETSVEEGGGPFGAVVVCNGEVIGRGSNRVTRDNDPTAHAEVEAIREACQHLGNFQLSGCVLYVNCEPCPMCLAAAYWARLDAVYYAASAEDAAAAGFDDVLIRRELVMPPQQRKLSMQQALREAAQATFLHWRELEDKQEY